MNTRDLGLKGEGAGKGDADRSPGWRDKYNEINWPDGARDGVKKFKKVYGVKATAPEDTGPHIKVS